MDIADESEANFLELINHAGESSSVPDFRKLGQKLLAAVQHESMNMYIIDMSSSSTGSPCLPCAVRQLETKDWEGIIGAPIYFDFEKDHLEIRLPMASNMNHPNLS